MPRNAPTERARFLRTHDTAPEARLWQALRNRRLGGWKWRRQVPVGRYIVDFLCIETKLVVELDGGQHAEQVAYDERRTAFLMTQGLRVLRFWTTKWSRPATPYATPYALRAAAIVHPILGSRPVEAL